MHTQKYILKLTNWF